MSDEQVVKFVDGCKLRRESSRLILLITPSQTILLMSYSQMDCEVVYCPEHLADNYTLLSRRTGRSTPMKFCEILQSSEIAGCSFVFVFGLAALNGSKSKAVRIKPLPLLFLH